MKILMISSYLPYPLHSGGQVRLYNLIKELSSKHEITLICEKRKNQTKEDIQNVEKICKKVITVDRHKQWSLENIVKSGASLSSFLSTGHKHAQMQQLILDELVRDVFDLIHVETFYVMQNLALSFKHKALKIPPIVLVEHNVEYKVYKRFVDNSPIFIKPLLTIDVAKIKREEEAYWRQTARLVAVSEEDKKIMEKKGVKVEVVSNGVNIDEFSFKIKSQKKEKKILFIGDFKWIQNIDSVKFIIEDIYPLINEKTYAKLWIVGREIPESIKGLTNNPDIIFDTEVSKKSAAEIFQEADILLAPIRVGGGTSYKILESMSCGTPVVTMQMSANAIGAIDQKQLMVGHGKQELAEKTIKLLEDKNIYKTIAINGRKLIEEKYSWKKIAKDLDDIYKGVVK